MGEFMWKKVGPQKAKWNDLWFLQVSFLYFLVSFLMCVLSVSVGIAEMQVWVEMASLFVIDAQHNDRGKNLWEDLVPLCRFDTLNWRRTLVLFNFVM